MRRKIVNVLLVEDDDIDVMGMRRAFRHHKIANRIRVARDGIEALEILRGTNGRTRIRRPYLILLDLDMPRMNGVRFLEAIRQDDELKDSLVFVLITSEEQEDGVQAHRLNVAGYMVKSEVGANFVDMVAMLDRYWRAVVFR
jgi:CheY-like chemotaxis protein